MIKKKDGIKEEHPAKEKYETIAGLKKKAEKSGMPYSILKKVYDRGMAAWRGGRQVHSTQWFCSCQLFRSKSSILGWCDKDLAKQVEE